MCVKWMSWLDNCAWKSKIWCCTRAGAKNNSIFFHRKVCSSIDDVPVYSSAGTGIILWRKHGGRVPVPGISAHVRPPVRTILTSSWARVHIFYMYPWSWVQRVYGWIHHKSISGRDSYIRIFYTNCYSTTSHDVMPVKYMADTLIVNSPPICVHCNPFKRLLSI